MITSAENLIFNEIDVADRFNFEGGYFIVNDVRGRTNKALRVNTVVIPGRHGSIARGNDIESRMLEIDYTLKGSSAEDLRTRLEDLHRIFIVDGDKPIQFEDEINRTYYGRLTSLTEREEVGNIHQGTLTILCQLPFKYGLPKTYAFDSAQAIVYNYGVTEAKPVVRANVTADISYMDVYYDGGKYMRIGQPIDAEQTAFIREEVMMSDDMASLVGWNSAGTAVDGGTVTGTMQTNTYSFSASSYGTGALWHGPAVKNSVPNAPLADFRVSTKIIFKNPSSSARGRLEFYLLDDQSNVIGKFGMKRIGAGAYGNTAEARVGGSSDFEYFANYGGTTGVEWRDFDGILEISRIGNEWEFYVARTDSANGAHTSRARFTFTDVENKYLGNLSQIQIHVAQSGTTAPTTMAVGHTTVYRINEQGETQIPIIASAGDVIEIDHRSALVSINGEPRPDLKDFGAQFFGVKAGQSVLSVEPSDAIEATVTFEEAYL